MKFEGHIDINQSREIVTRLFANPQYLKEYQEGFVRKELVSGEAGQKGAISNMYYQHGKHEMELTETVLKNDLPNTFEALYHHKHMDNTMRCTFESLGEKQTRYTWKVDYTRINWIMPRLISLLFPSAYKKPAKKWMENFKRFAESQGD